MSDLAVQLKTTLAIKRFLDSAILLAQYTLLQKNIHPAFIAASLAGRFSAFSSHCCVLKLLLSFEIYVYAGYFSKVSKEQFNLLAPHTGFLKKVPTHCPYSIA
jgi:hypothetical protein